MDKFPEHIHFGIICHDRHLFAWQEIAIKKLISETRAELKLIVGGQGEHLKGPFSSTRGILWSLYTKYLLKKGSGALKKGAAHSIFTGIPRISCNFITDEHGSMYLGDGDIRKIKAAELDFILNFSFNSFKGPLISAATYGIWSFHHSDPEKYPGSPSCFWEIYKEDVLTRACLVRSTEDPATMILLKEGYLKTHVLYRKNLDSLLFESASWPMHLCRDIRDNGGKILNSPTITRGNAVLSPPTNSAFLIFLLIQLKLLIRKSCKLLFYTDYWNIGIVSSNIRDFLDPQHKPDVTWFPNLPKARFIADPFGIYFREKAYILYEDFRFDQGIGKTGSFLFQNGAFMENKIVIDEKFHMSYPFVMELEGELYCIPETYQNNQVRLYKAEEFPGKWKLEKVLLENYAGIDNTPYHHKGTWYLFSTNKNSGVHHHLNIHYSDSIFGPWHEHPGNPVKTDIRSARPAGTIFENNGGIFRPSMDYSEKVEGRVVINKIKLLSRTDFREEMHNTVHPFTDTLFSDKVHTLSAMGPYTLVDGARELLVFGNFHALRYKVSRVLKRLTRR